MPAPIARCIGQGSRAASHISPMPAHAGQCLGESGGRGRSECAIRRILPATLRQPHQFGYQVRPPADAPRQAG